jgi:hypothetical protein
MIESPRKTIAHDVASEDASRSLHEPISDLPRSELRPSLVDVSPIGSQSGLRQGRGRPEASTDWNPCLRPAQPHERLRVQLNADWRVSEDDLQWILQKRVGRARSKTDGWVGRSFCTTRVALLRCISEYACLVDQMALALISALPHTSRPCVKRRVRRGL